MFQEFIISKDLSIDKFLNDLKCDFYLTKPQLKNLQTILTGMITNGYNGKISQISESSFSHRTSIGRFLSNSSWDENLITTSMKLIVLADSWYSSKTIFNATISNERNNYVGAIKTNRVLYPKKHSKFGIKASMFAKTLPLDSFALVTVRKKGYYVYKYVSILTLGYRTFF